MIECSDIRLYPKLSETLLNGGKENVAPNSNSVLASGEGTMVYVEQEDDSIQLKRSRISFGNVEVPSSQAAVG